MDLIEALQSYQQADEDGVMVLASRQAIEEAVAHIRELETERDAEKARADAAESRVAALETACAMLRDGAGQRLERARADRLQAEVDRLYGEQMGMADWVQRGRDLEKRVEVLSGLLGEAVTENVAIRASQAEEAGEQRIPGFIDVDWALRVVAALEAKTDG